MTSEPNTKVKSYRDLRVWQSAMDLIDLSYRLSRKLPVQEAYGLTSQMQRAAVSIAANIAEGHGRRQLGDYVQHLSIAHGSLMELETHMLVAGRLHYLSPADVDAAMKLATTVGGMLGRLIQALERRRRS